MPVKSEYLVPFDGQFQIADFANEPAGAVPGKKKLERMLADKVECISELQRKLYADNRFSLLLIFQAMDAAGKDGTIRAVMSGVNPAGCQVYSFKAPSDDELDHDWLWRTTCRLPERGRIGIFNRSYYEEVLAVRVNPEFLRKQRLPHFKHESLWQERFESIRDHEKHLVRNGTVVLKFWLNVSRQEQKKRFLKRLTKPNKYWKFSKSDLATRTRWDDYMQVYEELLQETSTENAPWFAIPADNKRYMRCCVADILLRTLETLPLRYPRKVANEIAQFGKYVAQLEGEAE